MTSDDRQHNLEVVEQFFSGPRDLDRLSLMSDDCEWFNGMGKFPAAPGQTMFRGKDEIGARRARAGTVAAADQRPARSTATTSPPPASTTSTPSPTARTCSASTTTPPRPSAAGDYENFYGFLFRFDDDGLIDRVWEHWGTLAAYEQLFQGPTSWCTTPTRCS